MTIFSNRYVIRIPNDILVFYCEKRQNLLIKKDSDYKILELKTKIFISKKNRVIGVTGVPFLKTTNSFKKTLKSVQGTITALIKQSFLDLFSENYKKLKLVGVGYKVFLVELKKDKFLHFKLGHSHSVYFKIPSSVSLKPYQSTKIFISGRCLSEVSQVASLIRSCKVTEPYKGKGISYHDEIINLKEGKKV